MLLHNIIIYYIFINNDGLRSEKNVNQHFPRKTKSRSDKQETPNTVRTAKGFGPGANRM